MRAQSCVKRFSRGAEETSDLSTKGSSFDQAMSKRENTDRYSVQGSAFVVSKTAENVYVNGTQLLTSTSKIKISLPLEAVKSAWRFAKETDTFGVLESERTGMYTEGAYTYDMLNIDNTYASFNQSFPSDVALDVLRGLDWVGRRTAALFVEFWVVSPSARVAAKVTLVVGVCVYIYMCVCVCV
jgi:hypothetical protein